MGTPCNTIIIINPTQRPTPTGRKGYYTITRARTSINRLSLALTMEFSIRRSPNNCPGYLRGRLSVVKHRQLARQVGAFDEFFFLESSVDLDLKMAFLVGTTFVFRS